MAENKKSFVLYSDNYGLIKQLPDEIAGKLFKHIFSYVNDENPASDDLLLNIAFESFKIHLKRDLKKYEASKIVKSKSARLGNLKRWNTDLYNKVIKEELSIEEAEKIAENRKTSHMRQNESHSDKKIAVNVIDNDIVIDSVINNNNIPEIKNFGDCDLEKNLFHAKVLKFESPTWMESVSMQQKISIEEIKNKIDDFVLFLQTTQTEHKIKKAFIEHFINWLTKKLNSEKNGKQQYSSSSGKKQFRFSTADAIETIARSD